MIKTAASGSLIMVPLARSKDQVKTRERK
jgi:hypothetical protein